MLINVSNTELLNVSMDLIEYHFVKNLNFTWKLDEIKVFYAEYLTAANVPDDMVINTINTIRENKRRPN